MERLDIHQFQKVLFSPALAAKYLAQIRIEITLSLTTNICVDDCNYILTPLMCSDICWDFII